MADNLVKLMDSDGYRQLINMLISIKSSQQEDVEKCISIWQPQTTYQKDKVVLVVNDNTYSEYICKATHVSSDTFDETYWTLVSCVDFEGYTEEELLDMLNLSEEELQNLQSIINNDEISTRSVWSSSKVYAELLTVLSESKNFTIAEVAKIVSFSYKVVASESEVVDDKAIYLIENASGTHDMYLLIDGNPSKVGNTSIDLSDCLKKENIVDTFDETTIYADSDKVFSTQASKTMYDTLNDKKVNVDNIVTTLNDTVTDEQVPSALATYNVTKDKNMKTYTSVEQLGLTAPCTTFEVFSATPNNSEVIIAVRSSGVQIITDLPETTCNGVLIIRKSDINCFDVIFKRSNNTDFDNYLCFAHFTSDGSNFRWDKVVTSKDKYFHIELTEDNAEEYMNDLNILTLPLGEYYISKLTFGSTLLELPSKATKAGRLSVESLSCVPAKVNKNSLYEVTYVYRTFIYHDLDGRRWIRTLNTANTIGVFEKDTGWQRICTTSVVDVEKTSFTVNSDTTNYQIQVNSNSNYLVRNGVCYVSLCMICNSPSSSWVELCSVPKCASGNWHASTSNLYIDTTDDLFVKAYDGKLYARKGAIVTSSQPYYINFSYPVASD